MNIDLLCNLVNGAGAKVPCDSLAFLALLLVHVPVGLACVVTGIVAMLSPKRPGRHPTFGTLYYWCLAVVFVTATGLASIRWAEDWYLFVLGALAFAAASLGRTARRQRWQQWAQWHVSGMGLSFILLLTAFYVDNGKNLPLWKELPSIAYWLLPGAIGIPLIVRALRDHPVVRQSKRSLNSSA